MRSTRTTSVPARGGTRGLQWPVHRGLHGGNGVLHGEVSHPEEERLACSISVGRREPQLFGCVNQRGRISDAVARQGGINRAPSRVGGGCCSGDVATGHTRVTVRGVTARRARRFVARKLHGEITPRAIAVTIRGVPFVVQFASAQCEVAVGQELAWEGRPVGSNGSKVL